MACTRYTYCTSPYPRTSISIHNRISLPHPSASLPTLPSLQTKRFLLSHLTASGNLSISLAYTAGHFLPTNHLLLSLLLAFLLVLMTNQKSSLQNTASLTTLPSLQIKQFLFSSLLVYLLSPLYKSNILFSVHCWFTSLQSLLLILLLKYLQSPTNINSNIKATSFLSNV